MNYLDGIREMYSFEVGSFYFLTNLGFSKSRPGYLAKGFDEVEYSSENFIFIIGMHEGRDENYRKFVDARTKKNLIAPNVALSFFLSDYERDRREIEESITENNLVKKAILVEVELYKKNPWIFKSSKWISDPDFISAINETDKWYWSQQELIKASLKYNQVLCSFKKKKYIFDETGSPIFS